MFETLKAVILQHWLDRQFLSALRQRLQEHRCTSARQFDQPNPALFGRQTCSIRPSKCKHWYCEIPVYPSLRGFRALREKCQPAASRQNTYILTRVVYSTGGFGARRSSRRVHGDSRTFPVVGVVRGACTELGQKHGRGKRIT